jgi:hypothetical protein
MMSLNLPLPHPDCYRIPGSRVMAGEYPFHKDPVKGRVKLRRILDSGVTVFIDLTEEGEELAAYEPMLREEAAARGVRVAYHRLPIPDHQVPSPRRMAEILARVEFAEEDGLGVYLHCWGGVGRTGTVVGCYLVRKGLSGEDALAQVRELFGTMSPGKRRRHWYTGSPQTEPQREFVRRWVEREAAPPRLTPVSARTPSLPEDSGDQGGQVDSPVPCSEGEEEEETFEFDIDAILRDLHREPPFTSPPLLSVVCQALDHRDVAYHKDTALSRVVFEIRGEDTVFSCIVLANEEKSLVCCYVRPPIWVPEALRAAMYEAINRANHTLAFGSFEMGMAEGELRYRTSLDLEGGALVPTMVHNLVGAGISMCTRYHHAFMRILYGGATPREAMEEVDG